MLASQGVGSASHLAGVLYLILIIRHSKTGPGQLVLLKVAKGLGSASHLAGGVLSLTTTTAHTKVGGVTSGSWLRCPPRLGSTAWPSSCVVHPHSAVLGVSTPIGVKGILVGHLSHYSLPSLPTTPLT